MRIECYGISVENREMKGKHSMRRNAKSQIYEKNKVGDREDQA